MNIYLIIGLCYTLYALFRGTPNPRNKEYSIGGIIIGTLFWPVLIIADLLDSDTALREDLRNIFRGMHKTKQKIN